ncbi:hypothetical protein MRX96_025221 [Rhipicephalus microplus]
MAMAYFKDLEEYGHLEDDVTQVVGMELGLKHALFDEYLLHDTVYVALAGVTVLAAMWAYTQSFLVTAVTCMAVVFSLGTAYFLYTTVFRISFFPFMNVLTLTIAIGIGAYIAFIYCKTWGGSQGGEKQRHAGQASPGHAAPRLSLHAGHQCHHGRCLLRQLRPAASPLSAASAGGAVAIFVHPRLRLPESPEFQVLSASHLFERYDLDLKERFWFEKARNRDPFHRLPIRIIWGVLPVDTGDYLNPSNKGAVVFDPAFGVADPASQEWLLSFCKRLRAQSFHRSALGVLFSGCFIETLKSWMERRCVDSFKQVA